MDSENPKVNETKNEKQLALELLSYLKDPKLNVRYGALNAILQFAQDENSQRIFEETDFVDTLYANIDIPEMSRIVLTTLIHFSALESYAIKFVDFAHSIILKIRDNTDYIEELGLLLLMNISRQAAFCEKVFEKKQENKVSENKLSPLVVDIIYGFLDSKPNRIWVVAHLLVNISSFQEGREYIATQKMYLTFIKYFNDPNDNLRIGSLRLIRNIAFLWQNNEVVTEMLRKDNEIIDRLCIHMLVMMIKEQLVHDLSGCKQLLLESGYKNLVNYEEEILPIMQKMKENKVKAIEEVQLCVDVILILSNANFPQRKPQFHLEELKQVIAQLNFTKISEQTKDKLEALQTFCFW